MPTKARGWQGRRDKLFSKGADAREGELYHTDVEISDINVIFGTKVISFEGALMTSNLNSVLKDLHFLDFHRKHILVASCVKIGRTVTVESSTCLCDVFTEAHTQN